MTDFVEVPVYLDRGVMSLALEAAEHLSSGVRGPFVVEKLT